MGRLGNIYRISALALLFGALALSCKKDEEVPVYSSEYITLDAAPGVTKGFLSTSDLATTGTQFQTYDYLSGYTGTISGHTNGEVFQYFGNTLTYKADATDWKWLFGDVSSPTTYRWTRTGTHQFFGWILADAAGGASTLNTAARMSPSFDESTRTLTVSSDITVDSPQYDFLYSDVVSVAAATRTSDKVNLPMKHLFGALGMVLSNTSENDVIVYGVSYSYYPNSASATISYNDLSGVVLTQTGPTYSGTSGTAYWPNKLDENSPITLYNKDDTNGGKVYDAYTGSDITESGAVSYRMAWPTLLSDIEPKIESTDDDGTPTYYDDSPLILVDCKVGTHLRSTVKVAFPKLDGATDAITAGKKTLINLRFTDKQLLVGFKVLPWEYQEFPMAFEGDAISATQLKFTENTYTDGGKETDSSGNKHVVVKLKENSIAGSYVATGTFKIYTPVNAVLSVGLGGNSQYFEAFLNHGTETTSTSNSINIDPHNNGGLITFVIQPTGTPRSGSRCTLQFSVRNNGRDADANTEINRDKYIIEIP